MVKTEKWLWKKCLNNLGEVENTGQGACAEIVKLD